MPLLPSAVARIFASSARWTLLSAPYLTQALLLAPPPPCSAPKPAGGSTKTSHSHPQKASLRKPPKPSRLVCMGKAPQQPPRSSSMSWGRKNWHCPNSTQKSTGKTTVTRTQASLCGALSLNVHLNLTCLHLHPPPPLPLLLWQPFLSSASSSIYCLAELDSWCHTPFPLQPVLKAVRPPDRLFTPPLPTLLPFLKAQRGK